MSPLSFARSSFSKGSPDEVIIVGLDAPYDKVRSIKEHHLFDERIYAPLKEEAIKNVMLFGVKEPILVAESEDGQHYLVVDGRQRVRWIREANRRLAVAGQEGLPLPVLLDKPKDEATAIAIGASLNSHGLADTVLAKAEKAIGMNTRGQTADDVATALGVSEASAKNFIRLGKADPKIKEALRGGKITPVQAYDLARLNKTEQRAGLEAILNNPINPKEKYLDGVGDIVARAIRAGATPAQLERAIKFGEEKGMQLLNGDKEREAKAKAREAKKLKKAKAEAAKAEKAAKKAAKEAAKAEEEVLVEVGETVEA